MNTREAHIVNTETGLPILDLDPIELEVGTDRDIANAFADEVMRTWETVIEAELAGEVIMPMSIVWTDTGARVQFLCPVCDDVCDSFRTPDNTCAMVCASCLD